MFVNWQQESTHENLIDQDNGQNTDDDHDECLDQQASINSSDEAQQTASEKNEQNLGLQSSKEENKTLFDEITAAVNEDSQKSAASSSTSSSSLKLRFMTTDTEQKENHF
jgi:hypothetical protein